MTPRRKTARPRPVTRTRTEAEAEADERQYAAMQRSAAIQVADSMIAAGCAGTGCGQGHGQHVAGIIQSLRILGIMHDPEAGARTNYAWGAAKAPRGRQ